MNEITPLKIWGLNTRQESCGYNLHKANFLILSGSNNSCTEDFKGITGQ